MSWEVLQGIKFMYALQLTFGVSRVSYVTIAIVWKTYVTSHQKHIVSQERIGQSC